jgi:hypothetical protein
MKIAFFSVLALGVIAQLLPIVVDLVRKVIDRD